ncbi:MAG: hypothetical protein JXR78_15680 [Victivallales bacterium]|nr:hypothetical protein [Victivallales bacterium]
MKIGVADHGVSVWEEGLYNLVCRLKSFKELGLNGAKRMTDIKEFRKY